MNCVTVSLNIAMKLYTGVPARDMPQKLGFSRIFCVKVTLQTVRLLLTVCKLGYNRKKWGSSMYYLLSQ